MKKPFVIIVFLVGIAMVWGCNPRPSLVSFNDKIVFNNLQLNAAGARFTAAANLAIRNPGNISQADSAFEDAKSLLARIKADWDYQLLPKFPSKAAPEVMDAYKEFLSGQETIVNVHMLKIMDTLKDGGMDQGTKQQVVSEEFRLMAQVENNGFNPLSTAIRKFTSEHHLQAEQKK